MTTPAQSRQTASGLRMYAWPPQPPHEFETLSVTTAIGAGLPKPFLVGWAAKMTAEAACDDYEIIGAMLAKDNRRAAVDHLKGARYRDMGQKADRGTIVHAAFENYLAGKPMTQEVIEAQLEEALVPRKMWRSAAAMIAGLMEFLYDWEPEVIWSESTVYSRKHGYAGTADLICRMRVGESIVPVVLDVKTSKRVYDETALQLAAYARADFVGLNDGSEMPLIPVYGGVGSVGSPEKIEHGVVIRPTPSGSYEKVDFTLTDDVFNLFLSVLWTAKNLDVLKGARRP